MHDEDLSPFLLRSFYYSLLGVEQQTKKMDLFCVAKDDNHSQPDLQQVHVEVSGSAGRDKGEEASLQPQDGRRAARALG
jgi:hypothetical protein